MANGTCSVSPVLAGAEATVVAGFDAALVFATALGFGGGAGWVVRSFGAAGGFCAFGGLATLVGAGFAGLAVDFGVLAAIFGGGGGGGGAGAAIRTFGGGATDGAALSLGFAGTALDAAAALLAGARITGIGDGRGAAAGGTKGVEAMDGDAMIAGRVACAGDLELLRNVVAASPGSRRPRREKAVADSGRPRSNSGRVGVCGKWSSTLRSTSTLGPPLLPSTTVSWAVAVWMNPAPATISVASAAATAVFGCCGLPITPCPGDVTPNH